MRGDERGEGEEMEKDERVGERREGGRIGANLLTSRASTISTLSPAHPEPRSETPNASSLLPSFTSSSPTSLSIPPSLPPCLTAPLAPPPPPCEGGNTCAWARSGRAI